MDSCSGNVEGFKEETHLITAGEGVERVWHTVREHFQQGRVYELSECLVAGPTGRANVQAGAFCKFTIGLVGPKILSP